MIVTLCLLGVIYCAGGTHGLLLAWSQPARMRRWARRVDCTAERIIAALDTDEPAAG